MKKENGITLISLVVTIIVLIILAGISINLLLGENGIITRAKYAKEAYTNAQISEEENLDNLYRQILNADLPANTPNTQAGTLVQIPSSWYADGKINAYAVATGNGEQVPIPVGFYYVGGTIDSGVVISDNENDKDKYAGREDVPTGVVYKENGTVDEEKSTLKGNQFVWIPVTVEKYKQKIWKTNNGGEYTDITRKTQTDPSELPQIEKYGGFYVARYEAGTSNIQLSTEVDFAMQSTISNWADEKFSIRDGLGHTYTGNITSKAGEIPYYHADYYTALKLSNNMYNTSYVHSGLVTGTMWDAIVNFIAGDNKALVTSNCTWGNYNEENPNVNYTTGQGRYATVDIDTGSTSDFQVSNATYIYGIRTTASTEKVKQKNLYDIAGNLWEWTQETSLSDNASNTHILRGGSFVNPYSASPACSAIGRTDTNCDTHRGFRPALFIQ